MSTNGQLVFTDVDKITFKGVGNASNAVIDTLTGKIGVGVDSPEANLHVLGNSYVSTNLELGGTLIMGTVNVESQHSLEAVTATGNITPLTVEFTNPTTSLVASGNVEVGGNVVAGYLYGDGSNITGISSNLDQIVNIGNVTSNTVQFTNPTTSLVASGNVEVGGDVVLSGNIYNNANLSVQYTTITPTLWTQVGQDIDGEAASDQSGRSVSMSSDGTRVAIGAPYNDANGSNAGHVRVYSESGGTWTKVGDDIDGEAADDWSGIPVSISSDGTRVAIGASGNDANGSKAGHVRVYSESGGTWTQVGSDIDGEAVDDRSGYSVSISSDGTRVAIGAWGNDGTGSSAGHVRVYSESGGTWTQVGSDIDGEAANDYSGWSVSMSSDGTRVAIGAPYNDGTGSDAGHVRVYAESGGSWTKVGGDIDSEAAGDWSGYSVSISSDGTRVAIGAPYNDANGTSAGHVRVYAESGGTWTQVGADIDGEAADDRSGWSVSISSDGTRVAIGAARNDANGTSAGHVRVFYDNNGTWTQVGQDIDGEAASDQSGYSVSISSDGTRVAIGAPYNDANGSSAGHVRVFDWSAKSKKILKDDIVEVGGELTVSRNVNVSGKVTRTYNPGEIIEELNTVCNGRSVTVQSGTYTPTNVTARQDSTSTHTEINGSNITYNKPAGAKRIYYKFACQWNDAWAGAITAFKIRIYHNGSWRDIDPSRHAHAAQYRGDANNHGATWVINEYIFECDASSESQHDGRFTSSKTSYTFDVTWRHHGGAGSTAYNSVLHRLDFFDGNVANNPIHPPQLTIRAIA